MKTVIFVGPSLGGLVGDGSRVRGPARLGDVIGAAVDGAQRIVLIDGVFGQELAVWHKEILEALRMGVDVIGAASMGALRALECERYGMRGVGRVFAMYRAGLIERDDEVALTYADEEHGWRNLSLPLVNVRMTLARAVREGAMPEDEAGEAMDRAGAIFYAERVWGGFLSAVDAEWARANYVDVKRADALEAMDGALFQTIQNPKSKIQNSFVRHGGLWDEDRVVNDGGEWRRLHEIELPDGADEMGALRAVALEYARELGMARPRCDDPADQTVADEVVIARVIEWVKAAGGGPEVSRQRLQAAGKLLRCA